MYGDTAAFPVPQVLSSSGAMDAPNRGLTVRQYTAIMMMQGMLANTHNAPLTYNDLADMALKAADALLIRL
jgi:hypothetical protein